MRWLVLLLMIVGCEKDGLTVGVASSLTDVMQDIAARHEAATGVPVTVVAASSGRIAQQQRAGAGYDAVVLASAGLTAGLHAEAYVREPVPVAGNRLVLIAPTGSTVGGLDDLPTLGRVAIGDPATVPAGAAAEAALRAAGLWDRLDGRLVYGGNVRAVLAYVERGEVDAGFVYATDVGHDPGATADRSATASQLQLRRVAGDAEPPPPEAATQSLMGRASSRSVPVVTVVPSDLHPPIVYAAAPASDAGVAFIDTLQNAADLFAADGFTEPGGD